MPSILLKKISKCLPVTLFLLFLWLNGFSQSNFEKLDTDLVQIFTKDTLPGLSVLLVNSKGIIYKKNLGFADLESKKPYTFNTIQNIGSVSKTFIAVALMKAIELNYFTLETDINEILPFKVVNPNHPDDIITVRELANHTSGIIDNPSIYPNSYKFYLNMRSYSKAAFDAVQAIGYQQKVNDTSLRQFFYDYLDEKGKYYNKDNFGKGIAGSTSSYSNIGSALVAYLIEIKSGLSYSEFATKYILKPSKMGDSGWFLSSVDLKKHAKLYYTSGLYFPLYNLLTYPDGGLKTSANDLSKYLINVIKGYYGDQKLLKPKSYRLMFAPQFSNVSPPKDINLSKRNKGIFWNLYTNGTIGHDGDDPGISTFMFFNTKTGIGGLFLCNKYLPNKQPIIDLVVGASN